MIHHLDPAAAPSAERPADTTFEPIALADDLCEVSRIYACLFDTLDTTRWDLPSRRGRREWTLHETIAHLCALNGAGLDSITHTLRGEDYTFVGLTTRYELNAYNRRGIDDRLDLSPEALRAELLRVHDSAADVARALQPGQADMTARMPIYNRPIRIAEALGILVMHAGLIHTAQVAEPAGIRPLWTQLRPDIRHREIGRVMRAFSLLYRRDIGRSLSAAIAFQVDGPGGGAWYVDLAPEAATSGEGDADRPRLTLHFRSTDDFCRMLTGRMNAPMALVMGQLKLRGELRLFRRLDRLFSVDARP